VAEAAEHLGGLAMAEVQVDGRIQRPGGGGLARTRHAAGTSAGLPCRGQAEPPRPPTVRVPADT
jgi:hypothetical protein